MDGGALLQEVWNTLSPWLASVTTMLGTVLVLIVMRLLFAKASSDRRGLPYQRQIASTLVGLVGVFAAVVLLPIDPDVRSQILSVLGVLLSAVVAFSSTSLVGNAMAGIMMRLTKSYRPGDFIEVEEMVGRVTDQGLFHTEIQLITRDIVALPNLYLSQHPVHVTRGSGTFVAVDVSLGYDHQQSQVDEALYDAVEEAGLEEPFVLVQGLLDHAIRYRVYGLLKDTNELLSARSRLRRAVIKVLHGRDIQIVSPGYVNRVEYPSDHVFVPRRTAGNEVENQAEDQTTESVEAIAFDKAEEAESIERLYKLQEKLQHDREKLATEIKEAEDKDAKKKLRERRDQVDHRIERTGEIIQEREDEREENELDE